jgi:hypothetical protein
VNIGGATATNPRATILVPPSTIVDDASVAGGSCTSLAGVINCVMDPIAGGAAAEVHLVMRSDVVGSNSFSIRVSADSDSQSTNNNGDGTIIVDREASLRMALMAPDFALTGDIFAATFTVTNQLASDVSSVNVDIELPGTVQLLGAALNGSSCQALRTTLIHCTAASLSGNSAMEGALMLSAPIAGAVLIRSTASSLYVDADSSNDVAEKIVSVTDTLVTGAGTAEPKRRGGGGAADVLLLLALCSLAAMRQRADKTLHGLWLIGAVIRQTQAGTASWSLK